MTLEEIKTKICDLRCSVEELQAEAHTLWTETKDDSTEKVASFLDDELGYIAYRLSELEELETDSEGNPDTDGLEIGLQEWWDDLSNDDKASIVGIPAPSRNDARGDEQYAFDDYCDKWWNAKTISQKQETYKEWADEMPWWEQED
jgi:hypothetical protein